MSLFNYVFSFYKVSGSDRLQFHFEEKVCDMFIEKHVYLE